MNYKSIIRSVFQYNKLFQILLVRKKYPACKKVVYKKREIDSKINQHIELLSAVKLEFNNNSVFFHLVDDNLMIFNCWMTIGNMPPDYSLILNSSLEELILIFENKNTEVGKDCAIFLKEVCKYIERIVLQAEKENINSKYNYVTALKNMITDKATNLFEALQRILFWSSVFWQTGHKLVGLGRLDKILEPYCDNNTDNRYLISEFIKELSRYYEFKSSMLKGDIGQIIVLGGLNEDGSYFCNQLTYDFISVLQHLKLPDPKIMLRVSSNMPDDLLKSALECVSSGIGSPLFSNDDVVVPNLQQFGYEKNDAFNYVVSACWEPLSYGNSLEQNNLCDINFAKVFELTYKDKGIKSVSSFEELVSLYLVNLGKHIDGVVNYVNGFQWEPDLLFSMFTGGCIDSGKDISGGGAKYNNYGLLSVGLGNAVNSLLNIKHVVFDKNLCSLAVLSKQLVDNDQKVFDFLIDDELPQFGNDDTFVIDLVNRIHCFVDNELSTRQNRFGGNFKWGMSSPNYIAEANNVGMTFDGRLAGDPLMVHISSDKSAAYTELVNFASQIYYSGISSNGNVVDFFVSPSFIRNNMDKFVAFLKASIKFGFFQMQMNVIDSETLIAAKNNPELYPNLIVRVWGFSAYFNDLPDEYKEVLINRALASEGK